MGGQVVAPFLKRAGGKRRLLHELLPRIGAVEGAYFEPFVGGGAVSSRAGATGGAGPGK